MNKDELSEMKTGRELDVLVAEKVMGLECYSYHQSWMQSGMPHIQFWSEAVQYPAYWNEVHEQALTVPDYSTDISAAWEVVEKLKLNHRIDMVVDSDYYVCVMSIDAMYEINADSAPEAICKAALLAVNE